MSPDKAFVYDFLSVQGGAEKFALQVAEAMAMDLVVGYADQSAFPPAGLPVPYKAITGYTSVFGWHALKAMLAFRRHGECLRSYDTVVFSGFYAPVAVRHRAGKRNLYYCHTPPRFAYDLEDFYLDQMSPLQRPVARGLFGLIRRNYEAAIARMDGIAANSANVAQRLSDYLGIEGVEVIHPPVETGVFRWLDAGDYYLSTARLEPYKRVELVVRAFMEMPNRQLVVASGGSELPALKQLAAGYGNIRFTGWQSEQQLRELIGRCAATVYVPVDEDFGLSPVESMAAGKPVIGVAEGGLLETVQQGETGFLINKDHFSQGDTAVHAICEAVATLSLADIQGMRAACEQQAKAFDVKIFNRKFRDFI